MGIVASQNFDSGAAETISFSGDALGCRGVEVILSQLNATQDVRLEAITSVSTMRYWHIQPAGTTANGARVHITQPIQGGTVRLIFSQAVTHRGRIILHDEPLPRSGVALMHSVNQVILAAGAANQIQMVQRVCGFWSDIEFHLLTTRPGHIRCFFLFEGATMDVTNVLGVTGATGGYARSGFFSPPAEIEIYLTNDDGINANTMTYALMCRAY